MPHEKEILLVTGGCRSGKSSYAQRWAEKRSSSRLFLATAQALDQEMADRIRRHKEERGSGWACVEEPLEVVRVVEERGARAGVILIDCVTIWLSNLMLAGLPDSEILSRAGALATAGKEALCSLALVTNEVGWGIVPENDMARRFRDLAGSTNSLLARSADRVVLMVSGIPLSLK